MPIGVIADSVATLIGGLIEALAADKIDGKLRDNLNCIFGLCACGIGILAVDNTQNLPVIVLSTIVGAIIGICLHLGEKVRKLIGKLEKLLGKYMNVSDDKREEYMAFLITVIVIFCASANGIYGSLDSGVSGDHTILIAKAIMDFFSAMMFAATLGKIVAFISLPQFIVYLVLYLLAGVIIPFTNPTMIADFKGAGGLLMLATGLNVMKCTNFSLVDMTVSLLIVMPVSYLRITFVLSVLG